jgi:hypothetical protein
MDNLIINEGFPLLSFLIFFPLAGAVVMLFFSGDSFARYWTLAVTTITAVFSIPLVSGFDTTTANYQFVEAHNWIPRFNISYILGVDGISILLVMLTTIIMPFCVLASWRYIQKRVTPFMICLLIMETSMIGVFVALDFVLFYILWEFMLIPMYLLIAIWGGPAQGLRIDQVLPLHPGRVHSAAGRDYRAVPGKRHLLHPGNDVAELPDYLPGACLPRLFPGLCHQGAHVSVPYMAAGRPCRSADRGLGDPGQYPAENGNIRFSPLLPAHHSGCHLSHRTLFCGCPLPAFCTAALPPWPRMT